MLYSNREVIKALADRYSLDIGPRITNPMPVDPTLRFISNVDEVLQELQTVPEQTISITATGWWEAAVVPAGYRASPICFYFYKSSGTWTVSQIGLADGTPNRIALYTFGTSGTAGGYVFPKQFWLPPGWAPTFAVDTKAVNGDMKVQILWNYQRWAE